MRVAVLMATYNGRQFIRQQIDSILSQSGDFVLDLFVRDDGSTDGTIKILEEYARKGQLKWYQGEKLGPALSFCDVLMKCGEYDIYAFSDQDDVWLEGKIQAGITKLKNKKIPIIYFANAELVDKDLLSLRRNVYKVSPDTSLFSIVCGPMIQGNTMMFNQCFANYIKAANLPKEISMHDAFLSRVCVSIGGEIIYDPRVYIKYRQHEYNVMGLPKNKLDIIMRRCHDIFRGELKVSMADEMEFILNEFRMYISEENKNWIAIVANYKNNWWNRMQLVFSTRTKYLSKNLSISNRLSILFGSH